MWPQLGARVRKLWARHASYMPADALLQNWLTKLTHTPNLLPIWCVVEERRIVAHTIACAEMYFGRPFVLIHQAQSDRPDITRQFKQGVVDALVAWIHEMNHNLRENGYTARFEHIRILTPHSTKFWRRWLPLDCVLEEHTLTFAVPEEKSEV
jgi:hypothetical protein